MKSETRQCLDAVHNSLSCHRYDRSDGQKFPILIRKRDQLLVNQILHGALLVPEHPAAIAGKLGKVYSAHLLRFDISPETSRTTQRPLMFLVIPFCNTQFDLGLCNRAILEVAP